MQETILKIENVSKQYRLGLIGTGTISHDLNRFWARIRGKEDPYLKVGAVNKRNTKTKEEYVWALRNINFEVKKGEVLGIIGKNGAGKSTLLKILSRVTSPTTGCIKTKGRIASLLEVGTGFHPELTGKENIYLNGAILGMTKNEINQKIEEIITFSGCEMYIDTPVKRYSSGMRVRLAFAVAAHLEPDILVVDEVLAVGDAEFQKKAIGKMQDISKGEGRTVLFVSHNMAAVKSLCSSAIILEHGQIVYEGETDEAVGFYLKTESRESNFLLKDRINRMGNGKVRLINAEILNSKGNIVNSVISGEFLRIKLYFELNSFPKSKVIIGIEISDINEELKTLIVTDEMDVNVNELIRKGYINLDFERFNLRGGNYFVKVVIAEGSTRKEDQLDNVTKAFSISVLPGDFFNIGVVNRSYNCYVVDCKFT